MRLLFNLFTLLALANRPCARPCFLNFYTMIKCVNLEGVEEVQCVADAFLTMGKYVDTCFFPSVNTVSSLEIPIDELRLAAVQAPSGCVFECTQTTVMVIT